MSNPLGGDSLESSTLPDSFDDDLLPESNDEFNITFDDTPLAPAGTQARRGQNEDAFEESNAYSDPDLGDIESPKIRDRIMRERRLRMEAEKRYERETEGIEQALLNSEKQKLAVQRDAFKLSIDGVDVRIRTAREALKQSRVDGDVNAETDIEAHLNELTTIRTNLEREQQKLPHERDLDNAYAQHRASRPQRQRPAQSEGSDDARPQNSLAESWASKNAWMNDPARAPEKAALVAISNQLAREGYKSDRPEHFVELTKRMAKTFPALGVSDLSGRQLGGARGQQPQPVNQPRSATPPVAGGRNPAPANRSKIDVTLDRSDAAMMRMLGMDTSNKKVVEAYVRSKVERLRSEARGR